MNTKDIIKSLDTISQLVVELTNEKKVAQDKNRNNLRELLFHLGRHDSYPDKILDQIRLSTHPNGNSSN